LLAQANKNKLIQFDDDNEEEEVDNEDEETDPAAAEQSAEDTIEDAWVILELARSILTKKLENPVSNDEKLILQKILADVHTDIGELYNEQDSFDAAIAEFEKAITLLGDKHHQDQSELYSKIAYTIVYAGNPIDQAIEQYEKAALVLNKHISHHEQEAQVGKQMLQELEEKIQELKDSVQEQQTMKLEREKAEEQKQQESDSQSKPVHILIPRRKRSREEEQQPEDESQTKKAKTD
jgi:tetratricopeptide (TPR) repeat protein